MKFDIAIMNPPYNRDLHLDILQEVIKHCDKVVNISPIRWLQDPLDKYKAHPKQEKYKSIVENMEDLAVVPVTRMNKIFGIGLGTAGGIYVVGKGGWKNQFKDEMLDKIIQYVLEHDTVNNHIVDDKFGGICSYINCHGGHDGKSGDFLMPTELISQKDYYTDGINEKTNETYLQYRTRVCWGNNKPKDHNTNIKFKDKTERENFANTYRSKFLCWYRFRITTDLRLPDKFLPWLDPSKVWTDADLCKEFGITGYISEDQAVPGSEWDTILKTYDCK